ILFAILLLVGGIGSKNVYAEPSLMLYTPYTGSSVTPGETITYNVDVINNSDNVEHVTFSTSGLKKGWKSTISANGTSIQQLSVRPNEEEEISLEVEVPLEVEKDEYQFELQASSSRGTSATLPISINVSEEGTFETELTTDQPNMEGHADSTFTYSTTLLNRTADEQHYSLSSKAPEGWNVQFQVDGSSVTSVTIEPKQSNYIENEVTPAENAKSDTYTIPITASSGSTNAELELEAAITGKYELELTTPDGNLSTKVTAGGEKNVELVVNNKGTADLSDISLSASTPTNWEVTFEEDTIPTLKAGEKASVKATINASDEAIAGDYVTTFEASSPEVSSEATFRVSVKTSTLWGIVGVVIILGVAGGLYYIFKKFGRR